MKKIISAIVAFCCFSMIFAAEKADALALYKRGEYADAIKICEQEIKDNPNNTDSYCVLCWSLVRNKQYAEGEARAVEARAKWPSDIRLMEILAEAKYYQGKNNGALEMFQTYIANAPSTAARIGNAYYYMGEIYIRLGRYQHADISMSAAVKAEPQVALWWTRCGYAREMAGSYNGALEAYNKALETDASQADAARGKERVAARLR